MKHEIIPIMADCRVGFSPPIPTINPIFSEDGKMANLTKTFAGVAASSAAWGWLRRKSSMKNRKSLCHCERSEAISLHHSLFLVRHSIFTTTFAFLLMLFLIAAPAQAKYGGGTGEPNEPYLIYTANQMNEIGLNEDDWDKCFILMADIDLAAFTGTAFNIIGSYDNPFTGVFDGNDHTISNFSYTSTDTWSIGLFGFVRDPNAEIKNLGLINPNVDAGTERYAGSLVSRLRDATINNCYVQGGSVSGAMNIGGLVGDNDEGTITNCYSEGDVSGDSRVGGLVGNNGGTISNCYATGSASGGNVVGGLAGYNDGRFREGTITNCYSAASVSGGQYLGGLLGYNRQGETANSFWDIETSGQTTSAGGTGKTTAEMKTASTFIAWTCCDCAPVWTIDEQNDYPRLWWENAPGETITIRLSLGGGTGTQADPYSIYTSGQLNAIGSFPCVWDKHFLLMADIDLSGFTETSFNITGTESTPFTGVFDGSGHTISNFSYTSIGTSYTGLFAYVSGENAVIKDLGLITPDVDGGTGDCLGSLVGRLEYGTIINCYVDGGSVSGNNNVGGLVGENWAGTIYQLLFDRQRFGKRVCRRTGGTE